jgi:hypothetical protein
MQHWVGIELLHVSAHTVRFLINKCYVWRTFIGISRHVPMPVAAPSKAWVCGRSHAEIAGSNTAGSMDVCLLRLLCVVRNGSLWRAEHSSRGVMPTVVYLTECDRDASIMKGEGGPGPLWAVTPWGKRKLYASRRAVGRFHHFYRPRRPFRESRDIGLLCCRPRH